VLTSGIVAANDMRPIVRQAVLVGTITLTLSAIALLYAQGRILPQTFLFGPLSRLIGYGCFVWSLPGVMLAVTIWGYNSNRTILSDAVIVAVNGILFAVPIVLFIGVVSYMRNRNSPPQKPRA
jgi:hypothetical protein